MKEIIILSQCLNFDFPLPQVLNACLGKLSTFLNIKLDGNKTISIFYPTIELAKLTMRNDYVSLTFIKSKFKWFCISYKDKLCEYQIHTTHLIQITSTMIKCSCRCYCSHNQDRLASHYQKRNWSKIKKTHINFRDHRNRAIDIVADTSSSVIIEMDEKPVSRKIYRPCFRRFLLNVQCPNEIS